MPPVIRKPAPATAAPMNVASLNPDNMLAGGLMDDFDGEIIKARFAPWDYNGNLDHHILAAALTIQPEDGDAFTQHYSAGELEHFAPSNDGQTPVDLANGEGDDLEGVYAARVGKKEGLNNNSNFAQFIGAAIDAGIDKSTISGDIRFLEGLYGHFNRIPQKKRSGIVAATTGATGGQAKRQEILVLTELKEKPATAPKAATAATKVAAARPVAQQVTAPAANGDLDGQLAALIIPAVKAAPEGLPKAALGQLALKGLPAATKAKGLKRVQEVSFLESNDAWAFDADAGMLFSTE